jgi:uncharacterized membrane protein YfcA
MMEWNEMRTQWQQERVADDPVRLSRPEGTARLWRRVRSRDGLETLVAGLLALFFGAAAVVLFTDGLWVAAAFSLFLVAVVVYIPFRLWRSRRLIPEPDPERPVREFLAAERDAMVAQDAMLRSVARWYYGPIAVGVIGFYTGIQGLSVSSAIYAAIVIALCAAIEVMNRRAVEKSIRPAIEQIDEQIEQLEEQDHD